MTSKEKHPEISRPVIRKGRRRRSSIGKVHLAEVNLPSIHDLIAEAKTYQRGWFTKSYDDVEGQAIEKKIMIVKNVAPTLKKFVKGMNNFKNSASEAENYNREFIQEMKQSMYQVTGFPEFGDSVPAAGKAFSIVHQGFRVNEMNVGKFVNKISTTTQKFNSFADRAIEELEKICGARSDFAQNYLDKKSKYAEALAEAKKKRTKRGWFGSSKKVPVTPDLEGKPEDDVEVVQALKKMKYAMQRLRIANSVLKNRFADFWTQREELMASTLRRYVLMEKKRLESMLSACNQCLEQIPTDGVIDEHYRSKTGDVTFVKTASLDGKSRLPTPKPKRREDVTVLSSSTQGSIDKGRVPTPAHQLEKKIQTLVEMGFTRNSSGKALREAKGDTSQAVALLLAGNKAMKMMTGRKRTSTSPVKRRAVSSASSTTTTTTTTTTESEIPSKSMPSPPKRTVRPVIGKSDAKEIAHQAMIAARKRKERSKRDLLSHNDEDENNDGFKNQALFQFLKQLTSPQGTKGGRRCSTYSKVKGALIDEFGESAFKEDKIKVQEYLRTGGKGPAPSLPPDSSVSTKTSSGENYVVETSKNTRIGLICRSDGTVMWKRNADSSLPRLYDRLVSINDDKIKYEGQEGEVCADLDTPIALKFSKRSSSFSCSLPFVLVECVAYIRTHGMAVDGIFRKNGNLGQCSALRDAFVKYEQEKGKIPDLEMMLGMSNDGNIRTVASLLKMYFRELKDPLIPYNAYDDLIKCGADVLALKALLSDRVKVPQQNYDILASLMYFLKSVSKHSDVSRMTPNALSICWAQSLMRTPTNGSGDPTEILMAFAKDAGTCNSIVEIMIDNVSKIFEEKHLYSWL